MTTDEDAWAAALKGFSAYLALLPLKADTAARYVADVQRLGFGAPVGPWEITPKWLGGWMAEHNWSKATSKRVMVSLRAFYSWGIGADQCEHSPLIGMPGSVSRGITGPEPVRPKMRWLDPIYAFLRTLEAGGRAPGTIRIYRVRLTALSYVFRDPWTVTYQNLVDYLARADWSPEYKHQARTTIMMFYRWAERQGYVMESPAQDLEPVKRVRALPRPTPTDVLLQAFEVADRRTRLAIELSMYAGLRRSEVVQVGVADIVGDQLLVQGKGGRQRIVPIHPVLLKTLRAEISRRLEEGEHSPWLFPSTSALHRGDHLTPQHMSKLVGQALGEGYTMHTLRHRFASQAYAATRDLRAVQELLGHSKPETTAVYAAVPDGARSAAVAGVGL